MKAIQELLISLKGYNSSSASPGIVVLFREVSRFDKLEFAFELVQGSQPVHEFFRVKASKDPAEVHRKRLLLQQHLLRKGDKTSPVQLNLSNGLPKLFHELEVVRGECHQANPGIPSGA